MKYRLSDYQYDLPAGLIAQRPAVPRDHSRLMILDRQTETISEVPFYEIRHLLTAGDSLTFNDTKVIPARLFGHKESGAKVEVLLLKPLQDGHWKALAKPGRKLRKGEWIHFGPRLKAEVIETLADGMKLLRFESEGSFDACLQEYGHMPLPHYIREGLGDADDLTTYQTVYARHQGAVAAPTAGLHFTGELLDELSKKSVDQHHLTLHVGMDTFRPVRSEDIREHPMHAEHIIIDPTMAERYNQRRADRRHICVGTTACRALESAADPSGKINPGVFDSSIFIYPGYTFRAVEALLTNFHLPGSTLLMLVSAFAGYDFAMEAYHQAVKRGFRFYSYGDAMLIL